MVRGCRGHLKRRLVRLIPRHFVLVTPSGLIRRIHQPLVRRIRCPLVFVTPSRLARRIRQRLVRLLIPYRLVPLTRRRMVHRNQGQEPQRVK